MNVAYLIFLTALIFGCGSGGEKTDVEKPQSERPSGEVVAGLTPLTVTGKMVFLGTDSFGEGYEVWILDYIDGSSARFPLDASGKLSIPLSIFKVDHVYSFFLAKNMRMISGFDFSAATDGPQSALVYDGGYGFDLGKITVKRNHLGEVDLLNPGLGALYGGGFRLATNQGANLADLPPPVGVESFDVVGQLNVFDPIDLRYGFYTREYNSAGYAAGLREYSRFIVSLKTRFENSLSSVSLHEADEWVAGTRLADANPNVARRSSPLWSESEYIVPTTNKTDFIASVFVGDILRKDSFAIFKLIPEYGPTLLVPRDISKMITVPPLLREISLDGGPMVRVDYSSDYSFTTTEMTGLASSADGLLIPFCYREQKAVLSYELPRGLDGNFLVGPRYGIVDVVIDYYKKQTDGRILPLQSSPVDFSEGFAKKKSDTVTDGPSRQWDPEAATVRFVWGDQDAAAMSRALIELSPEMFPLTVAGELADHFRLRVYYRHKDHPGEAASAFFIRRGC